MIVFKSANLTSFAFELRIAVLFASILPFPSGVILPSPATVSTTVIDADCKGIGKIVNVT